MIVIASGTDYDQVEEQLVRQSKIIRVPFGPDVTCEKRRCAFTWNLHRPNARLTTRTVLPDLITTYADAVCTRAPILARCCTIPTRHRPRAPAASNGKVLAFGFQIQNQKNSPENSNEFKFKQPAKGRRDRRWKPLSGDQSTGQRSSCQ